MGLIDRVGHVIHRHQGWFLTDSLTDAPTGSWGSRDGFLFERLGHLDTVGLEVPKVETRDIPRTARWFADTGASYGDWKTGVAVAGVADVSVDVTFDLRYSVVCFLAASTETQMENLDAVGDRLCELEELKYNDKDRWKASRKWVYTSLKVSSGFIMMSLERNVSVTISGRAPVLQNGVPLSLEMGSVTTSNASAVEWVSLDNVTPFVKLCEVYDPLGRLTRAVWRQIG